MRKLFVVSILVLTFCAAVFAQTDTISPCPKIEVTGPASAAAAGETLTFTANVDADNPDSLTYNWTVSDGTIIEGLGTPTIKVAISSETGGETITANVEIKGLPAHCKNTNSAQVQIPPVCYLPRVVDDYGRMPFREEKYRLANVASELKQTADFAAFFIIRIAPKDTYSSVKKRIANISKYLSETQKIPNERIQFRFMESDEQNTRVYLFPIAISDTLLDGETRLEEIRPPTNKP